MNVGRGVESTIGRESRAKGGLEIATVMATHVGLLVAGLATQSILAYALMPEGRGAYATCVVFASLMSMLFTLGVDAGAQYFVMARRLTVSEAVSASLPIYLVGSGLAIVISLPLIQSGLLVFRQAEAESFYVAMALIPTFAVSSAFHLQLSGLRRFRRLALISTVQSAVTLVVVAILVRGLGLGVEGALAALCLAHGVFIGLCVKELHSRHEFRLMRPEPSIIWDIVSYAARYYPARVATTVDSRIGILLLGILASRADLGLFSLASVLMAQFRTIPNSISTVILPRVAEADSGRPELVALSTRLSLFAGGAGVVTLILLSDRFIGLVFSESFLTAIPLIWVMAPGVIAYTYAGTFLSYFRGINRPEVCSYAMWLGIAAYVGSFFLFFPLVGLTGAAIAATISLVTRSIYLAFMFHRTCAAGFSSTWLTRVSDAAHVWMAMGDIVRSTFGSRLPYQRTSSRSSKEVK